MEQKYLCNNCGNNGHLFYNCKKPITSLGMLCYRLKENEIQYLLIQNHLVCSITIQDDYFCLQLF